MIEDIPDGIEKRLKLEQVRDAFQSFINSVGYTFYVEARQVETKNIEDSIIMLEPLDRPSEIEQFKLRGDRRTTIEFETLFEDTVSRLEDRIVELRELEQPTDAETNKE